jgi:hypothetical protein
MNNRRKRGVLAAPSCSAAIRTICVGGATKDELLAQLRDAKIELNEDARRLFAHDAFTTSATVAHSVRNNHTHRRPLGGS